MSAFGIEPKQFEILNKIVIDPLKSLGAEVYIFGSRARGDHQKFSDVDILFISKPGVSIPDFKISEIKEQIEESNFILKVDLVDDKYLADSYRSQVDKEKKLL